MLVWGRLKEQQDTGDRKWEIESQERAPTGEEEEGQYRRRGTNAKVD